MSMNEYYEFYKDLSRLIETVINNEGYPIAKVDYSGGPSMSNIDMIREDISIHESALVDAHGMQETILDVINEQLLENGGLEVANRDGNNDIPEDWILHPYLLGGVGSSVVADTTKKKYGTQSLKFNLKNTSQYDLVLGISQEVPVSKLRVGEEHSLSYYYCDDGLDDYEHYAEVIYYDSQGKRLGGDSVFPEKNTSDSFIRSYLRTTPPEGAVRAVLVVGAKVKAGCVTGSIWIDYVMLNVGGIAFNPPELVAGIIRAKHIYSDQIEARHIRADEAIIDKLFAGEIDTNKLKITSSDGTMVLEGNTFKIKKGQREEIDLIILGKLSNNEHGLQINDDLGSARIKATPSKITISDVEIEANTYILNPDGSKTYLSQVKQNELALSSKVEQVDFDDLGQIVSSHTSEITQTSQKISQTIESLSVGGNIATLTQSYNGSYSQLKVTPLLVDLKSNDTVYIVDKSTGLSYNCIISSDINKGSLTINCNTTTIKAVSGSGVHLAEKDFVSRIEQTASAIRAEVSDIQSGLNSSIEQTAGEIRSEVNDLEGRVNSSISQTAGQIRSEVSDIEQGLQSSISQQAGEISAITSRVNTAEGTISSHTTQIQANASAILLKASQTDLNALTGRVGSAESSINVQSDRITSLVSSFSSANSVALLSTSHSGIKTSLSVKSLAINIKSGDKIYLIHKDKGIKVDVVASTNVNIGATSIPISSFTFPEAFPADSGVYISSQSTSSKIDQQAGEIEISVKAEKDGNTVSNPKIKISAQNEGYILLDAREVISTGTIKSEHIDAVGLNAQVIKTGIMDIVDGLAIKSGKINIDSRGFWAGDSFEAANVKIDVATGKITAVSGEIGGFDIGQSTLSSTNGKLILDSDIARFILAHDENYQTYIQPEGVLAKVPLMQVSDTNYNPYNFSNNYYVTSVVVKSGDITYKNGIDFLASPKGEITKFKTSDMPLTDLTVEYKVIDNGSVIDYTETGKNFEVKERASAVITADTLIDANYINNLIVGATQIGIASITDAHIVDLSADKIKTGILNISEGITIGTDYGLSITPEKMTLPSDFAIDFSGDKKDFDQLIGDIQNDSLRIAQALIIDNKNTTLFHFDEHLTSTNGTRPIEYRYVDLVDSKFNKSVKLKESINTRLVYPIDLSSEWSIFTYIYNKRQYDFRKTFLFSVGDLEVFRLVDGSFEMRGIGGTATTSSVFDSEPAWYGLLLSFVDDNIELTIYSNDNEETIVLEHNVSGDKIFFGSKEGHICPEMLLDELRLMTYYTSPDEARIWYKLNQPFLDNNPAIIVPMPTTGDMCFVDDEEVEVKYDYYYLNQYQIIKIAR